MLNSMQPPPPVPGAKPKADYTKMAATEAAAMLRACKQEVQQGRQEILRQAPLLSLQDISARMADRTALNKTEVEYMVASAVLAAHLQHECMPCPAWLFSWRLKTKQCLPDKYTPAQISFLSYPYGRCVSQSLGWVLAGGRVLDRLQPTAHRCGAAAAADLPGFQPRDVCVRHCNSQLHCRAGFAQKLCTWQ